MALMLRGVTPLLEVFDMPRSIAFYRDVLGFEVVETSQPGTDFTWARLKLNDAELMLNSAYEAHDRPQVPDPTRVAGHADTELFFGCPDLDAACVHLRANGLDVDEPVVRDYGMRQLWLTDPDGFRLCLQRPASRAGELTTR